MNEFEHDLEGLADGYQKLGADNERLTRRVEEKEEMYQALLKKQIQMTQKYSLNIDSQQLMKERTELLSKQVQSKTEIVALLNEKLTQTVAEEDGLRESLLHQKCLLTQISQALTEESTKCHALSKQNELFSLHDTRLRQEIKFKCDQNAALQEKVSSLEREVAKLNAQLTDLRLRTTEQGVNEKIEQLEKMNDMYKVSDFFSFLYFFITSFVFIFIDSFLSFILFLFPPPSLSILLLLLLPPIQEAVLCKVCKERFCDTIIVKCYHTFCKECIKQCIDNRSRKCPRCGEKFAAEDVHNLF